MRILILEPFATGHHASYLRWLAQAANRNRWGVVIASTRTALSHPLLSTIHSDFDDVHIHAIGDIADAEAAIVGSWRLIRKEYSYWRVFNRAAGDVRKKIGIDAVVLPYIDYCFYALAILGSPFRELPWFAISMRLAVNPNAASGRPPFKWRMAKRLLASPTLGTLFAINPSVQRVPRGWCPPAQLSKLRYLPDPAQYRTAGRRESRAALGISDTQPAILVFGTMDERKGVDSLLDCLSSQDGLDDYLVILAGRQSEYLRGLLRTEAYAGLLSRGRLIVLDRFLSDTERDMAFAAADIVWVAYRNHVYMSGVLVLAGKAGVPVVGGTEGEIGRLIQEHDLGVAVPIDHPAEVARALRAMLDVGTRADMGRNALRVFASHTVENFGASVIGALGDPRRLRQPSSSSCS